MSNKSFLRTDKRLWKGFRYVFTFRRLLSLTSAFHLITTSLAVILVRKYSVILNILEGWRAILQWSNILLHATCTLFEKDVCSRWPFYCFCSCSEGQPSHSNETTQSQTGTQITRYLKSNPTNIAKHVTQCASYETIFK